KAKAEAIAAMTVNGSKLHYDLFNSHDFQANYFNPSLAPGPANVSYVDRNGRLLRGSDYLQMLANLQYDPRPPVYIETNSNGAGEFRFYLDFNRNGHFETNGLIADVDDKGNPIKDARLNLQFENVIGDPEWIGVLERPDLPHSETNRFIG